MGLNEPSYSMNYYYDLMQYDYEDHKIASSYHKKFKEAIIQNSNSDNYEEAIREWDVVKYDRTLGRKSQCICTHSISDNYHVRHWQDDKTLVIGSECIKRFGTDEQKATSEKLKSDHERKTRDCQRCGRRFRKEGAQSEDHCEGCHLELTTRTCGNCSRRYQKVDAKSDRWCDQCFTLKQDCVDCGRAHFCETSKEKSWRVRCGGCYKKYILRDIQEKPCITCKKPFKAEQYKKACYDCYFKRK
jgi:hypothetical protein